MTSQPVVARIHQGKEKGGLMGSHQRELACEAFVHRPVLLSSLDNVFIGFSIKAQLQEHL